MNQNTPNAGAGASGPGTTREQLQGYVNASLERINWERVPFMIGGFHRASVRDNFKDRFITRQAVMLERELSQDEVDAVVEHFGAAYQKGNFAKVATSVGLTIPLWLRGYRINRFPFFGSKQMPILLAGTKFGPVLWQVVRGTAYWMCTLPIAHVCKTVTELRSSAGANTDPRLQTLKLELKQKFAMSGQHQTTAGPPRVAGRHPDHQPQWQVQQKVQQEIQQEVQHEVQQDGPIPESSYTPTQEWQPSEAPKPTPPTPYPGTTSTPTWPRPAPPLQQPQLTSDEDEEDEEDPFDDASPVAPSQRSGSGSSAPGGSAWDRLRSEAARSQPQQTSSWEARRKARAGPESGEAPQESSWESRRQQNLKPGASSERDWTYKSDDAAQHLERERERERAQKEFDAMLERERQGSDGPGRRP